MTGISDGMEAKKSPGLQTKPNNISLPLPPPYTHPHPQKEKQTNRETKKQKEKISSLMKPHSHKKYLVKFCTPQKSRNQKTSNPPPPNPSIPPPHLESGLPPVTGRILRCFAFFINTGGVLRRHL